MSLQAKLGNPILIVIVKSEATWQSLKMENLLS
jgi:hypothetical protein